MISRWSIASTPCVSSGGRGNRIWGARTMSSDPEWKYVNVRQLFIYLERSLDKGIVL